MKKHNFLKQYDLHTSEEVESAAVRRERRSRAQGMPEQVPQKPGERIQNYLDRFSEIINRKDAVQKQEGVDALKELLHRRFIIKPQDVPEEYFELQSRKGDIALSEDFKYQVVDGIQSAQIDSMDKWIDYMTSDDAMYPDWLKYWAMRSVLGLEEYDKKEKVFPKRTKETVKPFPDLNQEALALVLDAVNKKVEGNIVSLDQLSDEQREVFNDLLDTKNFAKLYAWAVEQLQPTSSEEPLKNIKGKWMKYSKESDPSQLVKTLQGHSTGWGVAGGVSAAEAQLERGDIHVYYSEDGDGEYTIPRAVVRMRENIIIEVAGIAPEQNLDPYIGDVVHEKLGTFGKGGESYQKRIENLKRLDELEEKVQNNQALSKDDLIFLYELKQPIEGFGYQRDSRIMKMRGEREMLEDASIIFECDKSQIASNEKEITENTKAYIGKLYPGIFDDLPQDIEHVYTSFPEYPINFHEVVIGGKDGEQLKKEILARGDEIIPWAEDIMDKPDFTTSKEQRKLDLVEVSVKDLGLLQGATLRDIYKRAKELGLEMAPAEVGPNLRIQYADQPIASHSRNFAYDRHILIGMEPIVSSIGDPMIFMVSRNSNNRFLNYQNSSPRRSWDGVDRFVFIHPSRRD